MYMCNWLRLQTVRTFTYIHESFITAANAAGLCF